MTFANRVATTLPDLRTDMAQPGSYAGQRGRVVFVLFHKPGNAPRPFQITLL
jgi:hypothetical protein